MHKYKLELHKNSTTRITNRFRSLDLIYIKTNQNNRAKN